MNVSQKKTTIRLQAEDACKEKHMQLERELTNVVYTYEASIHAKQGEVAQLKQLAEDEKKELQDLQDHFDLVEMQEAELQQMEKERQAALAKKQFQEERRMRHLVQCAIRIQGVYRAYKAFKASLKKKDGKKKKAGGKKTGTAVKGEGGDKKNSRGSAATKKEDKKAAAPGKAKTANKKKL